MPYFGSPAEVYVEDPDVPGSFIRSKIYVGETDPAVGGDVPYVWIKPSDLPSLTQPSAKAFRAAAYTIAGPVGTSNTIPFDTEVYDTDAGLSGGSYTAPAAGLYFAATRAAPTSPANTERFLLEVQVNGTVKMRDDKTFLTGMGSQMNLHVSGDLSLVAGDVVTFQILQVNGTLRGLEVGFERNCWGCIRRVRSAP